MDIHAFFSVANTEITMHYLIGGISRVMGNGEMKI